MNLENNITPVNPYIAVLSVMKINGGWETETLICKRKDELFELVHPPFYAKQLAVGDLVKAEFSPEEGVYYIDHKIEGSGNSTIRIQCHKLKYIQEAKEQLVHLGCSCEINYSRNRIAINIPRDLNYNNVRLYLKMGESDNRWNLEESCIAHFINSCSRPVKEADIDSKVDVLLIRLGRNIRQTRTDIYKSLEQVSQDTGISVTALTSLEKGTAYHFEIGQLLRLAVYFGIEAKKAFM